LGAKLALFLVNDVSEHQRLLREDAVDTARRHGLGLEVHHGGDNVTTQIRLMRDCIRRADGERPRAIVVFPARDAAIERVAEEAVAAGVGWLVLNRRPDYLAGLRERAPRLPIAAVGPSQREIGALQARQVRALLPRGGNVLSVRGPTLSSAANDRLAAMREGLADAGVTLGEVAGNWLTDEAEKAVGSWLDLVVPSGQRPSLVACQNDAMATGARAALEAASHRLQRPDLARLPVTGVDGVPDRGQKDVDEGRLTATIVQPPSTGAALALFVEWDKGAPLAADVVLPVASYPGLPDLEKRADVV